MDAAGQVDGGTGPGRTPLAPTPVPGPVSGAPGPPGPLGPLGKGALLAVLLVAALVRIGWRVEMATDTGPTGELSRHLLGDERAYDALGRQVAAGTLDRERAFYQEPLYGWLLGQLYSLWPPAELLDDPAVIPHDGPHRFVILVQQLLGVILAGLVALLGGRCLGRTGGLLAGMFAAVSGPLVFHEAMLLKSSLGLVVFTSVLLAWLALLEGRSGPNRGRRLLAPWLTGVITGIGVMLRGNMYLLLPLIAVSLVWRAPRRWAAAAAVLIGAGMAIAPMTAHNLARGDAVLTTYQAGPNVAIGQPDSDDIMRGVMYEPLAAGRGDARYEEQDAVAFAEAAAGHRLSGAEVSAWWWGEALRRVRSRPLVALQRAALKLAHLFHGKEVGDVKDWAFFRGAVPWLGTPLSDLRWLGPLALAGFLLLPWRDRRLFVVRSGVVVVGLTLMLFYVMGRYRLSAAPCLWILAAGALLLAARTLRSGAAPRRVVVLGTLLAALLAGNLPALPLLPDAITGEMEPAHTSWANYATVELYHARTATDPAAAVRHRDLAVAAARRCLELAPAYPGARTTLIAALDAETDVLAPRTDEAWDQAWRLLLAMEGWRTGRNVDDPLAAGLPEVQNVTLALRDLPADPERQGYVGDSLAYAARRVAQGLRSPEEWPLALALLDDSLRHDPSAAEAHSQRGLVLKRMGRLEEAEVEYEAALAAGLGGVELHNNHGNLLLELGRPDEAVTAFEAALAEAPDHPVVLKNLQRARDALR